MSTEHGRIAQTTAANEASHDSEWDAQGAVATEAEAEFDEADLKLVEADAVTIGDPSYTAKQIVEVGGVGKKFSGNWWVSKVRHVIAGSDYHCEMKLQRNAVGASNTKAEAAKGKPNTKTTPPTTPRRGAAAGSKTRGKAPSLVRIDARTGKRL